MKKIVITGPESTGKSILAKKLSEHFGQANTEEEARAYLNELERPYNYHDLYNIAKRQIATEDAFLNSDISMLFCDTDLITIKIWSEVKYGKVDARILRLIENRYYDFYLLCYPDIPWVPDPLRENPHNRHELFELYMEELLNYGKKFIVIEGSDYHKRIGTAIQAVDRFL
ncbi:MAG TPA: AAA family ATPase [Saprospiraceae bacterium]|nr:AAA family ATPase [Saprospiraceae bacterium]